MKATFQSRTRSAIRSPSSLQYRNPSRGDFSASPLKKGMRVSPSRWTLKVLPLSSLPFISFATRSGSPAAVAKVGMKSSCAHMSLTIVPGLITPGQRIRQGTHALPSGRLFALEGCGADDRPCKGFCAVVGREERRSVLSVTPGRPAASTLADVPVRLLHAVGVEAQPGHALDAFSVREDVHARAVE